jgi:hypothetical protein
VAGKLLHVPKRTAGRNDVLGDRVTNVRRPLWLDAAIVASF